MEKIIKSLMKNGYVVSYFETKEEAVSYLDTLFDDMIIGFGDSQTLQQMNLYEILSKHNTVYDPQQAVHNAEFLKIAKICLTTDIFLTSVNGLTADGIIVNVDGTGNRVAGSLFGHKKMYYVIGKNKIAPNLEQAIWRVRNIAAPKNAERLKLNTPCSIKGDKCYDCSSPDRICNGMLIEYKKMRNMDMEVVLINENLGY